MSGRWRRDHYAPTGGKSPTSSSFEAHVRRLGVLEAADGGRRAGSGLFPAGAAGADGADDAG